MAQVDGQIYLLGFRQVRQVHLGCRLDGLEEGRRWLLLAMLLLLLTAGGCSQARVFHMGSTLAYAVLWLALQQYLLVSQLIPDLLLALHVDRDELVADLWCLLCVVRQAELLMLLLGQWRVFVVSAASRLLWRCLLPAVLV